jgi:hypothetical protein
MYSRANFWLVPAAIAGSLFIAANRDVAGQRTEGVRFVSYGWEGAGSDANAPILVPMPMALPPRFLSAAEAAAYFSGAGCDALLVSSRLLLTAAHCVDETISHPPRTDQGGIIGDAISVVDARGRSRRATCRISPGFASDRTADWALCRLENTVDNILYERVMASFNPNQPLTALFVRRGARNNRVIAQVTLAIPTPIQQRGRSVLAAASVAVEPGDSGGALSHLTATGGRLHVAVISTAGPRPNETFVATTDPMAVEFLGRASRFFGQRICGMDAAAVGCRRP